MGVSHVEGRDVVQGRLLMRNETLVPIPFSNLDLRLDYSYRYLALFEKQIPSLYVAKQLSYSLSFPLELRVNTSVDLPAATGLICLSAYMLMFGGKPRLVSVYKLTLVYPYGESG